MKIKKRTKKKCYKRKMLCRQNCFVIIMDGSFVQVLINNVTVSLKTAIKCIYKTQEVVQTT